MQPICASDSLILLCCYARTLHHSCTLRDHSVCASYELYSAYFFQNSTLSFLHPSFWPSFLALPHCSTSHPSVHPSFHLSSLLFVLLLFQLWSEMESSDDDTLSERSCVSEPSFRSERSGGSLSPCSSGTVVGLPGDTLPWNLSRHERRKRKSQDSVLDPAERAVVRVAGTGSLCTVAISLCLNTVSECPGARLGTCCWAAKRLKAEIWL